MTERRIPSTLFTKTEKAPQRRAGRGAKQTKASAKKARAERPSARRAKVTVVLENEQLRWLRMQVAEAKYRDERGVDVSSIIRSLVGAAMTRGRR